MGSYGGYFKGERKKKQKTEKMSKLLGFTPTFTPPQIIGKSKKTT